MDKGAKDKLVRSPGENGGGQVARKIFIQELEGTRRRGRPRRRWKEEVERDLQVTGVRRWTELVTDRKKWNDIVRQAKDHSGLQCEWKKKIRLLKDYIVTIFLVGVWVLCFYLYPRLKHFSNYITYNVSVEYNELYYCIRVFWATCFDSYRVIFRPFKNQIQDKMSLKMHCGIPNAYIV